MEQALSHTAEPILPATKNVKKILCAMKKVVKELMERPVSESVDTITSRAETKLFLKAAIKAVERKGQPVIDKDMCELSKLFQIEAEKASPDFFLYSAKDGVRSSRQAHRDYSLQIMHTEKALRIASSYAQIVLAKLAA